MAYATRVVWWGMRGGWLTRRVSWTVGWGGGARLPLAERAAVGGWGWGVARVAARLPVSSEESL
ncbi:hypothetical protein M885DRAFT_505166 [Pelagophyceae sp. CCMP2097]|nr:hypothetical protein M885DRAFT_505166 [Pelagophyceae sp. CCMP2097]